jgi:hypothetical protein
MFSVVTAAFPLALLLAVGSAAQPVAPGAELRALGDKLTRASSIAEMDSIARSIARTRQDFIEQMVEVLRSSKSNEEKIRACYLLGEFRAETAVDEVTKHIDLTAGEPGDSNKIHLWSRHPCLDALAYIGKPSERSLINLISGSEKKEIQDLAVQGLIYIAGGKCAASLLDEAIDSAANETEKARIRAALKQFGPR